MAVLRWVLLFLVGSVLDNLLTYRYVVLEHRFAEVNPFAAPFVYSRPLYTWFLRDAVGLLAVLGLYLAARAALERLRPGWGSRATAVVAVPAIARIAPVVHNVLLLLFGIESPLTLPYRLLS